jgi:predicted membrane metal-binding protein
MSTEKPQKRLVGKGRYYTVVGIKISLSAVSVVLAIAGVAGVVFCAVTMIWSIFRPDYMFPLPEYIPIFCVIIFLFCCSLHVWLWQRQIKPVAPIMRHNTGDLPEVETLVRASNLPRSHQQAELLRAAGQEAETPPEQLLRAGQGEGEQ